MKRTAKVICDSGLTGYQCRLQDNYKNWEEFSLADSIYSLASRLGYHNAKAAWNANPLIQGSVDPNDFRKVRIE